MQYAQIASSLELVLRQDNAESVFNFALAKPVEEALAYQAEFEDGKEFTVLGYNCASHFPPGILALYLVDKARQIGSIQKTIELLQKVLNTSRTEGFLIMLISGVECLKCVPLLPNVDLVPVDLLANIVQKNWVRTKDFIQTLPTPYKRRFAEEQPTAALLCNLTIEPFIVNAQPKDVPEFTNYKEYEILQEIQQVLTVVGPCTSAEVATWFQFEDNDLEEFCSTRVGHLSLSEIVPLWMKKHGEFDPDTAKRILQAFVKLEGTTKKRVLVAAERLNRAMRRSNAGDRATDLCIALETLLTDGQGENTFKVGLRSALLVGGDLPTRFHNRAIVGATYSLRSAVMHNGQAKEKVKVVKEGWKNSAKVADEAVQITAVVIRKIIECQSIPDWYLFELTGGGSEWEHSTT